MKMDNEKIINVYDMDIGKDPDDTCVAVMVALAPRRFKPGLLITNDEAESFGRARFLAQVVNNINAWDRIPVAAGLPSTKKRKDVLVERKGLITENYPFIKDGIDYLTQVLDSYGRIKYYGLGALTNLATVLKRYPEFSDKIRLYQMGMAFKDIYRRNAPQYNVRLDIDSFRYILENVEHKKFLMSHTSWGNYENKKDNRQELGIYVNDPVYSSLQYHMNSGMKLFAKHLKLWNDTGKDCSVMHDPLTVLSGRDTRYPLVEYVKGDIIFSDDGFVELTPETKEKFLEMDRNSNKNLDKIIRHLYNENNLDGKIIKDVEFSLRTDYNYVRRKILECLFGKQTIYYRNNSGYLIRLAEEWKKYNINRWT